MSINLLNCELLLQFNLSYMKDFQYAQLAIKLKPRKRREFLINDGIRVLGSFACAPPQVSGRILFIPPGERAIFSHDVLICNGTCSVIGGRTNGKDRTFITLLILFSVKNSFDLFLLRPPVHWVFVISTPDAGAKFV